MPVVVAVSASAGDAYICVECLEPAISSRPPVVMMLELGRTPP